MKKISKQILFLICILTCMALIGCGSGVDDLFPESDDEGGSSTSNSGGSTASSDDEQQSCKGDCEEDEEGSSSSESASNSDSSTADYAYDTAVGTYEYDREEGIVVFVIEHSDFDDCGPVLGTYEYEVKEINSTNMIFESEDEYQETWTRNSGTEGEITGQWQISDIDILVTIDIKQDGSFVISGDLNCDSGGSAEAHSGPIGDGCEDVSGTWQIHEETDVTDCGEGTLDDDFTIFVEQDGCNATLSAGGDSISGTVNGSTLNFTTSWPEDDGQLVQEGNITVSGNNINGSTILTYTEGSFTCNGSSEITGSRGENSNDDYCEDVSGVYDIKLTPTSHNCGENPSPEYYSIEIMQSGCSLTIYNLDYGDVDYAIVDENTVSGASEWYEEDGEVTLNYNITFTDSGFSGTGNWTYDDDYSSSYDCSGEATITEW